MVNRDVYPPFNYLGVRLPGIRELVKNSYPYRHDICVPADGSNSNNIIGKCTYQSSASGPMVIVGRSGALLVGVCYRIVWIDDFAGEVGMSEIHTQVKHCDSDRIPF